MKNLIYALVITLCVSACKKDENPIVPQNLPSNSIYGDAKLENGYLYFKDYQSFIAAMANIYSTKAKQKTIQEKSIAFVSMDSTYRKFNYELDSLEKLSKDQYFEGYNLLKKQYKKQIEFTNDSYILNCSGVAESYLANSSGLVKVGNDFLYLSLGEIITYSNMAYSQVLTEISNGNFQIKPFNSPIQSGKVNGKISYLYGSKAPVNSLTSNFSPFKEVEGNSGRAKFIARAKIYNINNSAFGNRGFVTYECTATHKNVFGTFRDVNYIAGVDGQINVGLKYTVQPSYILGDNTPHDVTDYIKVIITPGGPSSAGEGLKEFVVAASNKLISNHTALPSNLNRVEWPVGVAGVNDDLIQSSGGYWFSIESNKSIPIVQAQSTFSAMIIGDGVLSYPSVTFPDLDMAY